MKRGLLAAFLGGFAAAAPPARADQEAFLNSGGTTSVGTSISIHSTVASPPGALDLVCPVTTAGRCAGGSVSFQATDGTSTVSAAFTDGTNVESCSGGGRGGHITCGYTFAGRFFGAWTSNGATQAIVGTTSQVFGTGGVSATGQTAFNSAYAPFYYSDTEQILRSDDLMGSNQVAYGSQGSGVGQFYGAFGIALDSSGRIYVADTYNCRIVRFDDMSGTNWTAYGGTCGSGIGELADPGGIAVDALGRIYVLDAGNSRVVRVDDMSGTSWVAYGSAGSGAGQLAPYLTSIAVDSASRIYVADTGNDRIVRFDDMTGANWTTLTRSPPVNGVSLHSFSSPVAVALDGAGRIYVADDETLGPAVVRVDDMTGANWTSIETGGNGLHSVAVDSGGTVFAGGGGVFLVDGMKGVLGSSGAVAPYGSYYVFGVTPVPVPLPRAAAIGSSPPSLGFSQPVGTTSAPQTVTLFSIGGAPLGLFGASAGGAFDAVNGCPSVLAIGASCQVSVTFTASSLGDASGQLTIADDSGNAGPSQSIALFGSGSPVCGLKGDVDGDGVVGVKDVFVLLNALFAGGSPTACTGDVNGDGVVDVNDVFYLVNFVFGGGPAPE